MKDKLFTVLGYLVWTVPAIGYIACIVMAIKLIWMPLISLYGFLPLIGIWAGLMLGAYLCWFALMWLWAYTPPKPQATYKEIDNA